MQPYGFIYETTNLINGKKYIGQKKYDNNRMWPSYLGSGTTLRKAIKKYGKENFKRIILAEAYSKEELDQLEIYYIAKFNAVKSRLYYNLAYGGDGGSQTEESRKKISNSLKGRKMNPEAVEKSRKSRIGLKVSEETKQKISKTRKEKKVAAGENHPNYGKHLSKETRERISKARKGSHPKHTKEGNENRARALREKNSGLNNNKTAPVICVETGEIFIRMKDACEKYNLSVGNLSSVCQGLRHTTGGFHWKYVDKELLKHAA